MLALPLLAGSIGTLGRYCGCLLPHVMLLRVTIVRVLKRV